MILQWRPYKTDLPLWYRLMNWLMPNQIEPFYCFDEISKYSAIYNTYIAGKNYPYQYN